MRFATVLGGLLALGMTAAAAQPAVKLEAIPGSPAKRVILSAKAAQRLGIETAQVGMQAIVRRQMVSGVVVAPLASQPAPEPKQVDARLDNPWHLAITRPQQAVAKSADGEAWVRVTLSPAEWERLAKDAPARVLPLQTREPLGREVLARPSGTPPVEDAKRSMLSAYYVVKGADHGLGANKRMRVELQLAGGEEQRRVVPYGALYYDAKGGAWVYVNPTPLVFERRRVEIERVMGDLAVLSQGPEVGTAVVSVGAALLYGAEIFGK